MKFTEMAEQLSTIMKEENKKLSVYYDNLRNQMCLCVYDESSAISIGTISIADNKLHIDAFSNSHQNMDMRQLLATDSNDVIFGYCQKFYDTFNEMYKQLDKNNYIIREGEVLRNYDYTITVEKNDHRLFSEEDLDALPVSIKGAIKLGVLEIVDGE